MVKRKNNSGQETDAEEIEKAADAAIEAGSTPNQIARIRFVGLSDDAPVNGTVSEYLDHYTKRAVSFWNPLTQQEELRPAAEVIALQMVIAALHGDKSATNRLIERTEGKVSVDKLPPAKIAANASARELAEAVERDRQQELRDARKDRDNSVAAIARIMGPPSGMNAGLPATSRMIQNMKIVNDAMDRIGNSDETVPEDTTIM